MHNHKWHERSAARRGGAGRGGAGRGGAGRGGAGRGEQGGCTAVAGSARAAARAATSFGFAANWRNARRSTVPGLESALTVICRIQRPHSMERTRCNPQDQLHTRKHMDGTAHFRRRPTIRRSCVSALERRRHSAAAARPPARSGRSTAESARRSHARSRWTGGSHRARHLEPVCRANLLPIRHRSVTKTKRRKSKPPAR